MKKMARLVASLILAGAMAAPAFAGFEFHGYGRAGVLMNSNGAQSAQGATDQGTFDLNGPAIPFLHNVGRLGNENNNYVELELTNTFKAGQVGAATKVRLASKDYEYGAYPVSTETENKVFLRELYTEFSNLPFLPKSQVWAGKRFYGRDDIHINDFYWRIFDGTGAGVSNIPAGPGVVDVAYIAHTSLNKKDYPEIYDSEGKSLGKDVQQNLDIRYKGLKALGGDLEFELTLSAATGAIKSRKTSDPLDDSANNGYKYYCEGLKDATNGIQGAAVYSRADFFGAIPGSSKVALQVGQGLGANVGASNGTFMSKDAQAMQVIAWGVANVTDKFKVSPSLVYSTISKREGAHSLNGKDDASWLGFTVRPQYNFTRNLALQAEFGYERGEIWAPKGAWNDKNGLATADIMKLTIAPTITLDDSSFWTRPQLRAFVTFATYDKNGLSSGINDAALQGEDSGMTYGVQMETWF